MLKFIFSRDIILLLSKEYFLLLSFPRKRESRNV